MDRQAQKRRDLERDLRRAFANGEFELHYQPLVGISADRISGFESLLRWRNPEKGMISPAEFIPVAEDIGAAQSSPQLLRCLHGLAHRTAALLKESEGFAASICDFRLALEVAVITAMARRIVGLIASRDPLSQNVHLTKLGAMRAALAGVAGGTLTRLRRNGVAAGLSRDA